MNPLLRWYQYVLLGMGLQATMTVASEFGPLPIVQKLPTTVCFARRHPNPTNIATTANTNRVPAFATAPQSTRLIRDNGADLPNSMIFSNSIRSRSRRPSTRIFMLSPENREIISTIASLSFWPDVSYINEVVTWILGLSFMFVGASLLASNSNEERAQQKQQLAMVTTSGIDVDVNENLTDVLLTPGTYADSNSAERLVTDTVVAKASDAFDSTDFENEPHLSPELEDVEAAFEVALLANAAHAMADAAEKENRQSKAAMLEREKELEWIERHDEGNSNLGMIGSSTSSSKEMFQRSLLAAQLANKSTRLAKKQEAFQRSLLSSRIAYDVKSKESVLDVQHHEEDMEIDFSTAFVGEVDDLQIGVNEVAASEAEGDYEEMVEDAIELDVKEDAPISESDEHSMIGDDPVTAEHAQISEAVVEVDNAQPIVQAKSTSVQDQWRKDSVQAVRKYIHQKAIDKTKQKMLLRNNDVGDSSPVDNVAMINTVDEDQSTEISTKEIDSESEGSSVMKLFNTRALIRRMPRRRRLLVVALGIVITRRLFLAYFGNALSVI